MTEELRSLILMPAGACRVAMPAPTEHVNRLFVLCLSVGMAVVMALGVVALRRKA